MNVIRHVIVGGRVQGVTPNNTTGTMTRRGSTPRWILLLYKLAARCCAVV
jgi:hypothetical protein